MKRQKEIKIRLSADEFELLNRFVCDTGASSREEYLRCLIHGCRPAMSPSGDFVAMTNELRNLKVATDKLFHSVMRSEVSSTDVNACCMELKSNTTVLYQKIIATASPQPISGRETIVCLR